MFDYTVLVESIIITDKTMLTRYHHYTPTLFCFGLVVDKNKRAGLYSSIVDPTHCRGNVGAAVRRIRIRFVAQTGAATRTGHIVLTG